jgi:DNA-repair protein XRCC3
VLLNLHQIFVNITEIVLFFHSGVQGATENLVVISDLALKKNGLDTFKRKLARKTAAEKICKGYSTGTESLKFWKNYKHITFGCSNLDSITNGGLPIRGITEVAGEAGSGKSQICMQLAFTVQLPICLGGLGKKAAYISTQESFSIRRIQKLQESFIGIGGLSEDQMFDNILIQEVRDTQSLMNTIAYRLPILFAQHDIGILIIDSIAAPLRIETDYISRANRMRIMVRHLLKLSRENQCAVVCVNQVTSNGDIVIPSLGLAWANLVNTRIRLSKSSNSNSSLRHFEVISSELAHAHTQFAITPEGIKNSS